MTLASDTLRTDAAHRYAELSTHPMHVISRREAESMGYRTCSADTWGVALLLGVEPDELHVLDALTREAA
jgi:hypothetical protein